MTDFFPRLLLGHCFGDFVFQTKWMALNKQGSSFKCAVHCLIYTACIMLFLWKFSIPFALLVFVSHFIIDRFSLADKWGDLIGARSLTDFMNHGYKEIPFHELGEPEKFHNYHTLRGGFTSLVYAVIDNTFHLVIMYYGGIWLL